MALGNFRLSVSLAGERAGLELAGPSAQAHGTTHFIYAEKLPQLVDDSIGSRSVEFGAVGALQLRNLARVLDRGALHSEANPEKWNPFLAGVGDGMNHPGNAAFAETAWHEDSIDVAQAALGGGW